MYIAERMFLRWHKKTFLDFMPWNIYQGFRVIQVTLEFIEIQITVKFVEKLKQILFSSRKFENISIGCSYI
jgi:hypothetical protein